MKKKVALLLAGVLCVASLAACGTTADKKDEAADTKVEDTAKDEAKDEAKDDAAESTLEGTVTASGSSALFPLADAAAVAFKEANPNVSVTINAGGSGTGLKDVAAGTVDIGNSDVYAEEKLEADVAAELVDHKACVISMTPVVSSAVAELVDDVTTEELTKIFTGEIKNWSEVGGPDSEIMLITRPTSSGTRALFKEHGIGGAEEIVGFETDDSGELLAKVSQSDCAIGYLALSYLVNETEGVSKLKVDGVEASLETTYDGTWGIWGYEHMYTKGEAEGAVAAFLEYMMGEEFGQNIEAMGYGVTAKMTVER